MEALEIRVLQRDDLNAFFDDMVPMRGYAEAERYLITGEIAWRIFDNPAGEGIQVGLFEGRALAGIACVTPKALLIRGEPTLMAEIGGTETSSSFQGRGVFSRLVEFLVDAAQKRGYSALYGTPNEASGRIYMGKRLAWTGQFRWRRQLRLVNWGTGSDLVVPRLPGPKVLKGVARSTISAVGKVAGPALNMALAAGASKCDVTISDSVDPELAPFLAEATRDLPLVLDRNDAYLRWRFARPGRTYRHVYTRDPAGRMIGWAVLGHGTSSEGRSRAVIGDYWVHPWTAKNLSALMSAVAFDARSRGLDQVYATERAVREPHLSKRMGFISQPGLQPVIIKHFTLGLDEFNGWDYRDSDADMF